MVLAPVGQVQQDLFDSPERRNRAERMMQVMDRINTTYGAGTVRLAAAGLKQYWAMKAEWRSPRYTTRWEDLLVVGQQA